MHYNCLQTCILTLNHKVVYAILAVLILLPIVFNEFIMLEGILYQHSIVHFNYSQAILLLFTTLSCSGKFILNKKRPPFKYNVGCHWLSVDLLHTLMLSIENMKQFSTMCEKKHIKM